MASNSNKASWKDFKQVPSGDDALAVTADQVVGGSASQKGFAMRTPGGGDNLDGPSAQVRTMGPQATAQGAKSYGTRERQGIGARMVGSMGYETPMPEPMPEPMPRPSRRQGLDLSGIKGDDNSLARREDFFSR